jgi:hypothetical protein
MEIKQWPHINYHREGTLRHREEEEGKAAAMHGATSSFRTCQKEREGHKPVLQSQGHLCAGVGTALALALIICNDKNK